MDEEKARTAVWSKGARHDAEPLRTFYGQGLGLTSSRRKSMRLGTPARKAMTLPRQTMMGTLCKNRFATKSAANDFHRMKDAPWANMRGRSFARCVETLVVNAHGGLLITANE